MTVEDTVHPVVDSCSGIEVVSETCPTLKYKGLSQMRFRRLKYRDLGWTLMLWTQESVRNLQWVQFLMMHIVF